MYIKSMEQPHSITPKILSLIEEISKNLGKMDGLGLFKIAPELRKLNKIRTIYSTLAIEGNRLTKEQITGIINNKPVVGPKNEIIEVQNALEVYHYFDNLNPLSEASFKRAHKMLMKGLIKREAGKYRSQNVGVGNHIAPAYHLVPAHMKNLFSSLKKSKEPWLIKSCIFHYENEFVHPFIDGNGRMGRLWQTLLLCKINPIFECIPIENFVKDSQQKYYDVLSECDRKGESTTFIEYMLAIIKTGLDEFLLNKSKPLTSEDRLILAKEKLAGKAFSRADYMKLYINVSAPTATRDLRLGVKNKMLKRIGYDRTSKYVYKI